MAYLSAEVQWAYSTAPADWAIPGWNFGPFLKWINEELELINQRTRKFMTIHQALHQRDDIDCIISRKGGGNDSPTLRIALVHQYKNSETTLKRAKED